MTEGCAVVSVLGMLEEREAAARVRVEGLREEAARLAGVLEAAEIELDRIIVGGKDTEHREDQIILVGLRVECACRFSHPGTSQSPECTR